MTTSEAFDGISRLFLGTAPVIYFVERNPAYLDLVQAASVTLIGERLEQ